LFFCCVRDGVKPITWGEVGDFFTDTVNPYKVIKRTIEDDFQTAGQIAKGIVEGTPVVGHAIAAGHLAFGDKEDAARVFMSANSGTGAVVGGAVGTLCGPLAVVCVPALTVAGQTSVDGVQSVVSVASGGKPTGNIDYIVNFDEKSGVEHAVVGGSILLDAVTGGLGGRAAKKAQLARLNAKVAGDSVNNVAVVSVKHVDDLHHALKPKPRPVSKPESVIIEELTHVKAGFDPAPVYRPEPMEVDEILNNPSHATNRREPIEVNENLNDPSHATNRHEQIEDKWSTVGNSDGYQTLLDDLPLDNVPKLIPEHIEATYNKELANIKEKFTFLKIEETKHSLARNEFLSDSEFYIGPIKDFQGHTDSGTYLKKIEDNCLKYLKGGFISTIEGKNALKLKAASIKTDFRSLKHPELFYYSDEILYNVKNSDLVNINSFFAKSEGESIPNCARLSTHKAFDVDYDKINIDSLNLHLSDVRKGHEFFPNLKGWWGIDVFGVSVYDMERYLVSLGKHVEVVGREIGLKNPKIVKEHIINSMKSNNFQELNAVAGIFPRNIKTKESLPGHIFTFRATLKKNDELTHMIIDYQSQVSYRTANFPSVNIRFKQIEDLFKPNKYIEHYFYYMF